MYALSVMFINDLMHIDANTRGFKLSDTAMQSSNVFVVSSAVVMGAICIKWMQPESW